MFGRIFKIRVFRRYPAFVLGTAKNPLKIENQQILSSNAKVFMRNLLALMPVKSLQFLLVTYLPTIYRVKRLPLPGAVPGSGAGSLQGSCHPKS